MLFCFRKKRRGRDWKEELNVILVRLTVVFKVGMGVRPVEVWLQLQIVVASCLGKEAIKG